MVQIPDLKLIFEPVPLASNEVLYKLTILTSNTDLGGERGRKNCEVDIIEVNQYGKKVPS